MVIHNPDGVRLKRKDFPPGTTDAFTSVEATFYREGKAICALDFFLPYGGDVLVGGGVVWGIVGSGVAPVSEGIHVEEVRNDRWEHGHRAIIRGRSGDWTFVYTASPLCLEVVPPKAA